MITDVFLSPKVSVSAQLVYGYGRGESKIRKNCFKLLAEELEFALDQLYLLLNFDRKVKIRLTKFKKPSVKGQYFHRYLQVELKPSNTRHICENMLETLCHELVHAEQFYLNKLTTDTRKFYWTVDGRTKVVPAYVLSDYNNYRSSPWENEAFSRQGKLSDIIMPLLKEKFSAQN